MLHGSELPWTACHFEGEPELAELLEGSHWAALVPLAIREQQLRRDYVSPQVELLLKY